jgi:hypothetical protein
MQAARALQPDLLYQVVEAVRVLLAVLGLVQPQEQAVQAQQIVLPEVASPTLAVVAEALNQLIQVVRVVQVVVAQGAMAVLLTELLERLT